MDRQTRLFQPCFLKEASFKQQATSTVSLMVVPQQQSVSGLCYIKKDSVSGSKNSGRDIKMSCKLPMCSVLKKKVLQMTHYIRPPSIKIA